MKKIVLAGFALKALKITLGALLAIVIAYFGGLQNYLSAGIVTILTLQETKRETLAMGAKRLAAFAVSILVGAASFFVLGFHIAAFGVYLLVFTLLCLAFNQQQNIAVCAVLVGHFLAAKSIAPALVANQLLVMLVGVAVAVVVNLFVPRQMGRVQRRQNQIDSLFRKTLLALAACLAGEGTNSEAQARAAEVKAVLGQAIPLARAMVNNSLFSSPTYYWQYLALRENQLALVQQALAYTQTVNTAAREAGVLAEFVRQISREFHECNDVSGLLQRQQALRAAFAESPLPQTRAEFENRAVLFRLLGDLETLLLLKKNFIDSLSPEQVRQFAGNCRLPQE